MSRETKRYIQIDSDTKTIYSVVEYACAINTKAETVDMRIGSDNITGWVFIARRIYESR